MSRQLTRNILSSMLASTALVSCAIAQGEPRAIQSTRETVAYQSTDGDGRSVELRIENGEVLTAKVDGKAIPAERVVKVPSGYDLMGEDGKVLRHVAIARPGDGPGRMQVQVQREQRRSDERRDAPRGPERNDASQPRSMIGVGLGAPDEALSHHLRIDPAKSTLITNVIDDLPAAKAGIERFDVIVSVNGDRNASAENIRRVLRESAPGSKISFEVMRGGETRKIELEAAPFDPARLESIEVEGMQMMPFGDADGEGAGDGMMFFIGPDGKQRELRLPRVPGMGGGPNGFDPMQMEEFQRSMNEFNRRMEEWGRRMEQRMRDRGPDGGGDPADQPRPRDGNRQGGNDERLRRLEERMEQLMRELERERADRGDRRRET